MYHATSVKYSCIKQIWVMRDSNKVQPWNIESQEKIREWLAKITKIEVIAFACVQSSTDPDEAAYHKGVSFNTMRRDLGMR